MSGGAVDEGCWARQRWTNVGFTKTYFNRNDETIIPVLLRETKD